MDSTENRMRMIYAHVTIITHYKCLAYADGNRADYKLRLKQSDFTIQHESIKRM